jgi:single-strand DNA-binding protein
MSANINRVIIAGNLTRDPAVKFLASGTATADFGLAVNRKWRDKDGQQQEEVTFLDIEAWGKTAELVGQYLSKGRSCLVEGRLRLDQWEDQKTGQKRSKLKVVAESVQFLGGREEARKEDGEHMRPDGRRDAAPVSEPVGADDEDIPPF